MVSKRRLRKLKFPILAVLSLVGLLGGVMIYYSLDPALLARLSFYVDLANPYVRIVKIQEGLRKEQIAEVFANKLGWDANQMSDFMNYTPSVYAKNLEGHYFPDTYLIPEDQTPSEVGAIMLDTFTKKTGKIQKPKSKDIINEDTIVKIASLIQREAAGKKDMALISGIIWNRLFAGMKLQVDATLQYAKGSEEDGWWMDVNPKDKKIQSAYNTYMNEGLPPSAISNPGLAAISAAYNPQKTECLFYLHDKNRQIHCTKTYEEHKKNIERYY